ncbi:MAG: divalent-cation tolerance protein CutA [Thiotrichales bacterium]|nr:divalent-cation tolerance protein CutA [Thiotrichales bacterium]
MIKCKGYINRNNIIVMSDTPALLVLCTCPDQDTADTISRVLVEARQAACVNVLNGIRSCYRWQGRIERDEEVLMLIKTMPERLPALEESILKHHPYELPEIIAVPIKGGHQAYLDWITDNTLAT